MSSLLLVLDDEQRRLPEQAPHYLWMDAGRLRVSEHPPDRSACFGYFVSELGAWWFHTGPARYPRELRINGRPADDGDVALPADRAEVRLSGEPYSQPERPRRPRGSAPEPEQRPPGQLVVGPPGSTADIVIDHPSVVADHARVEVDARGTWWLTARNGDLFVDGEPVTSAEREPGCSITIGGYVHTVPLPSRGAQRALAVEVAGLNARRGGRPLLDDVSLDVAEGEFAAVYGQEAASAWMLLGALAGGYRQDSGTVRVGRSSRSGNPRVRWVPADDDLHGTLTVEETLRLAIALRPSPGTRGDTGTTLDEIVSWIGLSDKRDKWVRTLSEGERKRLSIGVEIAGRPGLLLVLDSATSYEIGRDRDLMSRLRTISRDLPCTVIAGTRSVGNLDLADQVVVFDRRGRLRHAGPPGRARTGRSELTWPEYLATMETPAGDLETDRPAKLPEWRQRREPEGFPPALLVREALLFWRRGTGALATCLVMPLLTVLGALASRERLWPLLVVAVAAGAVVGRIDPATQRGPLRRDLRAGIGAGAALAAKSGLFGLVCAVLAAPMAWATYLFGTALPRLPGLPGWWSQYLLLLAVMLASVAGGLLCASAVSTPQLAVAATAGVGVVQVLAGSLLLGLGWLPGLLWLVPLTAVAVLAAPPVLEHRL
ncbi:ATP-binding cassette domain-containing protein [Dactylosporangium sucinum]|uniref:ABC transporter domain-containing protein n=1 Tax=Dactylosporangium sucinum TaxID=1424081 RepID=A0A917TNZ0_9ACTN|nr:ATP-binding cassette domain-containing protein [Dactylosporangium sucinum]GGM27941.1 hypothetical protein GCM10007977_031590 [Dactylosporangium sucinum]